VRFVKFFGPQRLHESWPRGWVIVIEVVGLSAS